MKEAAREKSTAVTREKVRCVIFNLRRNLGLNFKVVKHLAS